jgi:hypothetical protein
VPYRHRGVTSTRQKVGAWFGYDRTEVSYIEIVYATVRKYSGRQGLPTRTHEALQNVARQGNSLGYGIVAASGFRLIQGTRQGLPTYSKFFGSLHRDDNVSIAWLK